MERISPYLRARLGKSIRDTRAHLQGAKEQVSAIFRKLRYGAKDPQAWNENFSSLKKVWKSQTRSVEEKDPDRLIHRNYIHD